MTAIARLAVMSLLMVAASAWADEPVVGEWFGETPDGQVVELSIESGGKFVFDQQQRRGLERVYMCGVWALEKDRLTLDVRALKERLANGQIEQLSGHTAKSFTILASDTNKLVIKVEDRTVALQRVAPRRS